MQTPKPKATFPILISLNKKKLFHTHQQRQMQEGLKSFVMFLHVLCLQTSRHPPSALNSASTWNLVPHLEILEGPGSGILEKVCKPNKLWDGVMFSTTRLYQ